MDRLEGERGLSRLENDERNSVRKEFLLLAVKEETFWRQHLRIRWLKDGDKNTKFFHKMALSHNISNSLDGLFIEGEWCQDQRKVREEVEVYYKKLYSKDHFSRPLLDGMEFDKISVAEKSLLEMRFSEEEVWRVVFKYERG